MIQTTIVIFPKIQVDTVIACFLMKKFGEQKFPGASHAKIEFWSELPPNREVEDLEAEGYILIDLGGGKFDHHRLGQDNKTLSASHLVAQFLEVDDRQDLQKLLEFARRDDLEGKGTLSLDPIDRSFGLSGLLSAMNKSFPEAPQRVLNAGLALIEGHYLEENRRFELLPKEFESLKKSGKVKEFEASQLGKRLKVVYVESDNPALAGYVRSRAVGGDLIIQKAATGHVNFITRQSLRLHLEKLAGLVKLLESQKNQLVLNIDNVEELSKPGRTSGLPHWFYDSRANTLQNGGVNPQNIPPTKFSYDEIEKLVKQGLNIDRDSFRFRAGGKGTERKGAGVQYL